MAKRLRKHLTFANVCSALALFLVVAGGTAVATGRLGKNVVKSRNIAPGQVKTSDLHRAAVRGSKLAAGAVTTDKLAAGAVGSGQLAAGAVGSGQLGDGAVTGSKIAPNSVDASKIPNAPSGSDAIDADTVNGLPGFVFQFGDGADQLTQGADMGDGDQTPPTVIANGTFSLKCEDDNPPTSTPTLEFSDDPGDAFATDSWELGGSDGYVAVPDGDTHAFPLRNDGVTIIQLYGPAGDVIVASTHDTGSGCTMIAHSMSNISTILAAAAAGHRRPALHPRRAFSRRHGSG